MDFTEAWNREKVVNRVHLAKAADLLGIRGSASWEDIPEDERTKLENTIISLSRKHRERIVKKAKNLGVSVEFLEGEPIWIQQGRAPTPDEFRDWARSQHKKSCKRYEPAVPISRYNGMCYHCKEFNKPCTSFFANTGICETGYFEIERIKVTPWNVFQEQFRKAERRVGKKLKGQL
jgi:hypothetical protein